MKKEKQPAVIGEFSPTALAIIHAEKKGVTGEIAKGRGKSAPLSNKGSTIKPPPVPASNITNSRIGTYMTNGTALGLPKIPSVAYQPQSDKQILRESEFENLMNGSTDIAKEVFIKLADGVYFDVIAYEVFRKKDINYKLLKDLISDMDKFILEQFLVGPDQSKIDKHLGKTQDLEEDDAPVVVEDQTPTPTDEVVTDQEDAPTTAEDQAPTPIVEAAPDQEMTPQPKKAKARSKKSAPEPKKQKKAKKAAPKKEQPEKDSEESTLYKRLYGRGYVSGNISKLKLFLRKTLAHSGFKGSAFFARISHNKADSLEAIAIARAEREAELERCKLHQTSPTEHFFPSNGEKWLDIVELACFVKTATFGQAMHLDISKFLLDEQSFKNLWLAQEQDAAPDPAPQDSVEENSAQADITSGEAQDFVPEPIIIVPPSNTPAVNVFAEVVDADTSQEDCEKKEPSPVPDANTALEETVGLRLRLVIPEDLYPKVLEAIAFCTPEITFSSQTQGKDKLKVTIDCDAFYKGYQVLCDLFLNSSEFSTMERL